MFGQPSRVSLLSKDDHTATSVRKNKRNNGTTVVKSGEGRPFASITRAVKTVPSGQKSLHIQSNFSGSNTFGTMKISSRQG